MRKKILALAAVAFVATLGFGAVAYNQANVAKAAEEETPVFAMVGGAQVRTTAPSGIRFVTKVNDAYKDQLYTQYPEEKYTYVWGTTLTFDYQLETHTIDAPTKQWTANETQWYTALVGIPESDYLTEITAQSYVKVYYKANNEFADQFTVANPQTRSIAQTASLALNSGKYSNEDDLYTYTNAIENAEVEIAEESGELLVGTQTKLTATVTKGYGIAWRSSDPTVATVDKDGVVTTLKAGEATITARLGTATDTYEVTVTESPESALLETFYYRKGTNDYVYHNDLVHAEGIVGEDKLAYGIADLGDKSKNVGTMYMTLSSEYMGTLFADEKIVEIKFDAIISVDAKKFAITRDSSEKVVLTQESTSSAEVNGVTYYTYTLAITREYYETYCVEMASDMTLRYTFSKDANGTTVEGSGNASTFFYIANVTAVEGVVEPEPEPETKYNASDLIAGFSNKYSDGYQYALAKGLTLGDKTDLCGVSEMNTSNNSATMWITLSSEYMNEIFVDESVKISFDVIIEIDAKTMKIYKSSSSGADTLANAASTGSMTVGEKTYYIYTLTITYEQYEKYGKTSNMIIRYSGGTAIPDAKREEGKTTTSSYCFYVGNLQVVK